MTRRKNRAICIYEFRLTISCRLSIIPSMQVILSDLIAFYKVRRKQLTEFEYLVLLFVHDDPGVVVGDVCKALEAFPAQMSRVVWRLQSRKLLALKDDLVDRRKTRISLTERGELLLTRIVEMTK